MNTNDLLRSLLKCYSPDSVRKCLQQLGDSDGETIEHPFGPDSLKWVAFGDNPSNISTIGLATKPGKSLSERLTNGMDALLEGRAAQHPPTSLPQSPREAAAIWFGRPVTGPDTGLFQGMTLPTDKRISVLLLESGKENSPTIDVLDNGVGLLPAELRGTILSLQAGNKIKKRHQIGAFGQGGSSTLGFSDFVLVVSRSQQDPSTVAFTVIRVLKLDASYKEDCYAYLVGADGHPFTAKIPPDESIDLYEHAKDLSPPTMGHGTLVRHIAYRLGALAKPLAPSPGNLYHYLHYTLFDPILPFRIWDLRLGDNGRNEYVGGSRNRLMRALAKKTDDKDKLGNIQVRHHRAMEYIVPSGGDTPCIGIEYWVVLAFKKVADKEPILRGNSAELFVQSGHPIVGTLNGQTQGELTGLLLKEVGLGLLARHTIVHIDASAADSRIRRELFSTSREGFKDGPVLESLIATLRRMLEEDQELAVIEGELTERLSKRDTATTREEVRQQVTRLLKEAGLQVTEAARSDVPGAGANRPVGRQKRKIYTKPDPLPTLPFPQATFFKIVSPVPHLKVSLQDSELVLVETDADAEFDKRSMIGITSTDNMLQVESKSSLSGGRVRWRLRPAEGTHAGAIGEVRVFLNKPNGEQLADTLYVEVLPPREKPSKVGKTTVPPFEIEPITPSDTEKWDMLWSEDGADEERQLKHAYKAHEHGGKTWVYYSEVFPAYANAIEKLKLTKPELVQAFSTAYEVWIAYHAILQQQSEDLVETGAIEDQVDEIMDQQRAVVATMQVKQALQHAELWKRIISASEPGA